MMFDVPLAIVDAFLKFNKGAWLHPKNDHVTQTTPLSGGGIFTLGWDLP